MRIVISMLAVFGLCLSCGLLVGCAKHGSAHSTASKAAVDWPDAKHYGEPMKMAANETMPVGMLLARSDDLAGKPVRVSGTVGKVCQKKGCWLEMTDPALPNKALFVHFTCPVKGRLIPLDAVGKPVVVEGTLEVKEISEADARHIREESGAAWSEVEKIKGPQKQITLAAPAAMVAM